MLSQLGVKCGGEGDACCCCKPECVRAAAAAHTCNLLAPLLPKHIPGECGRCCVEGECFGLAAVPPCSWHQLLVRCILVQKAIDCFVQQLVSVLIEKEPSWPSGGFFWRLGEVQEMLPLWLCAAVCAKGPVVDQHILLQEVPRAGWHFEPSMPVTASSHRLLMDKPIN